MCRPVRRAHTRVRPYKYFAWYFRDATLVTVAHRHDQERFVIPRQLQ